VSDATVILGRDAGYEALDARAAAEGFVRAASQMRLHERARAVQWERAGARVSYIEDHLRGVRYLYGEAGAVARIADGFERVTREALEADASGGEVRAALAALQGLCVLDGSSPGPVLAARLEALSRHDELAVRRAVLRMMAFGAGRAMLDVVKRAARVEVDATLRAQWRALAKAIGDAN
jgi:hypothetical protein